MHSHLVDSDRRDALEGRSHTGGEPLSSSCSGGASDDTVDLRSEEAASFVDLHCGHFFFRSGQKKEEITRQRSLSRDSTVRYEKRIPERLRGAHDSLSLCLRRQQQKKDFSFFG